ncbi:major facilitator superfamily protein [Halosimplex carlsbadense 2-9-1]|uniref:Major facilitator superfamily protein n=1 Tax=Halosimplex carlsbadense 2-9-1 TaxID=797114 RepID=M0D013_9EURY|nr:MFS transporter [Halosimplex carlsbadense]ELZ28805.1 major facilitator superfamily protein [Halosimplex carlsbadense 2-9-1]
MSGPAADGTGSDTTAADARNRRLWTVVIFLTMACTGAVMQVRGAVLPTLEGYFTVPEWQLGLVAPAGTVGYLLVILAVGSSAGRIDARRFIAGGAFLTAGALLAMGLSPSFPVFLAALVVQGAAVGVFRALDRPLLSHFYPSQRGRVYNRYDATWAIGAALGPLAVVLALRAGSWRLVYGAVGVAVLALAVAFRSLRSPAVESDEEPLTRSDLAELIRRPEVIALLAALFFVTGVEGGLFTWLPYYARAELPAGWAELTLTVMLAAYIPGRFACGALTDRLGPLTLLLGVLGLLVPAFGFTFFVADGLAVLGGVVAIGLLISGVFPTMMAYATDAVPEHSGPVNALASAVSSVSIGGVPAVMGVVVGGADAAAAMRLLVAPLVGALGVIALARVAQGRRDARAASSSATVDD